MSVGASFQCPCDSPLQSRERLSNSGVSILSNSPLNPLRRAYETLKRLRNLRMYDESKLYAVWEQRHLRRLLAYLDVDCVFDVGANYGQYAEMLRQRVGFTGRIISFEPMPDAVTVLKAKSARDPKWTIEGIALSSSSGARIFHIMKSNRFSSLGQPLHTEVDIFERMNAVERTIEVQTETLEEAYMRLKKEYEFSRPFLKMDTQGFDVDIVRAASLVMPFFLGMQSELAVKRIYEQSVDFRDAIAAYKEAGFDVSAFVPNNAGHFPQLIEMDGIFVRRDIVNGK
jgi:FkbM family methyltransferase